MKRPANNSPKPIEPAVRSADVPGPRRKPNQARVIGAQQADAVEFARGDRLEIVGRERQRKAGRCRTRQEAAAQRQAGRRQVGGGKRHHWVVDRSRSRRVVGQQPGLDGGLH